MSYSTYYNSYMKKINLSTILKIHMTLLAIGYKAKINFIKIILIIINLS